MAVLAASVSQPFVDAAVQVLQGELGVSVVPDQSGSTGESGAEGDVIVMVGVTGSLSGMMVLAMAKEAACAVVGMMMMETVTAIDAMAKSALAELGNMVAGISTVNLERCGYSTNITPPSVLTGREIGIETVDLAQTVIPLQTSMGVVRLQLYLRERAA